MATDQNLELINTLAKKVWEYHHLNHLLGTADCILVLGGNDRRVAERGAELFLAGLAPFIVFSGGFGMLDLTKGKWKKPEAEAFADIAIKKGVPQDKILIENKSTNTGENILLTKKLLAEAGLSVQKMIIVHKPYMERRAYATTKKVWPELEICVTSPQISFEDYPNDEILKDDVINIMVGDLQRIKLYPEKGFQIPQVIPNDVWAAYAQLIGLGYGNHLVGD